MSTNYDRLPTLDERVRAASLIVMGRVQSIKPLRRTRIGDVEEEQAVAHVAADKVLRGALAARELSVRFVRSRGDSPRPEADAFVEGKRLLLFVVPDVGRDATPGTYVAHLGGAFALTADDSFAMEIDARSSKGRRRIRQTLGAVRDLVKRIGAEEAADARAWERVEPYLAKRPALPSITELPDTGLGTGPLSSEPIAAAPPRPPRQAGRPRRGRRAT
jgi:hypothetical protein